MKYCVIIISLQAKLHKVPHGLGAFLGPQLNLHITQGGVEDHLALGGGLSDVDGGHEGGAM